MSQYSRIQHSEILHWHWFAKLIMFDLCVTINEGRGALPFLSVHHCDNWWHKCPWAALCDGKPERESKLRLHTQTKGHWRRHRLRILRAGPLKETQTDDRRHRLRLLRAGALKKTQTERSAIGEDKDWLNWKLCHLRLSKQMILNRVL